MKRIVFLLGLISLVLLAACSAPVPTPTLTPVLPTATPVPPTRTPRPTPILIRYPLPTPTPSSDMISPENALSVTQLAQLGKGTLGGLAWSPDGKLLAFPSSLGIYLYDAETLEQVKLIDTSGVRVSKVFFVPSPPDNDTGEYLLASTGRINDNVVRFWDVHTGQVVRTLKARQHNRVFSIAFDMGGRITATAGGYGDPDIHVWLVEDVSHRRTLNFDQASVFGHRSSATQVAISPDGRWLAGIVNGIVGMWDLSSPDEQPKHALDSHKFGLAITFMAFSPDSHLLALGRSTVQLWDVESGQFARAFQEPSSVIDSIAFSPARLDTGGYMLATGHEDGTIQVWDAGTGRLLRMLKGHPTGVFSLGFSPDGKVLASGGWWDGTAYLWDVGSGQLSRSLQGHMGYIDMIALDVAACLPGQLDSEANVRVLAAGSDYNAVLLWDAASGRLEQALSSFPVYVDDMAFDPNGCKFAIGGDDDTAWLWDAATGQRLHTLEGYTGWARSMAFNYDGSLLAVSGSDETVRLWAADSGQLLHTLELTSTVYGLAFSPDGRTLATASESDVIHLWSVQDGQLLCEFHGGEGTTRLAFSPDGRMLISEDGYDEILYVWDTSTGQVLRALEGYTGSIWSFAFSPDGRILAAGGGDGAVYLWDINRSKVLHALEGHADGVTSLVFSADGYTLFSGSNDGTVRLWGIANN